MRVITDGEPDDFAALAVMIKAGVVITRLVMIDRSKSDSFDRANAYDGFYSLFPEGVLPPLNAENYLEAESVSSMVTYLTNGASDADGVTDDIICLGNFLPLVKYVEIHPQLALRTNVYVYASVNLRWGIKSLTSVDDLDKVGAIGVMQRTIMIGFKRIVIFETFPLLGKTSAMSEETMPKFIALLRDVSARTPLLSFLADMIMSWNDHIFKRQITNLLPRLSVKAAACAERLDGDVSPLIDELRLMADELVSARIALSCLTHDMHMVFADVGLALALCGADTVLPHNEASTFTNGTMHIDEDSVFLSQEGAAEGTTTWYSTRSPQVSIADVWSYYDKLACHWFTSPNRSE